MTRRLLLVLVLVAVVCGLVPTTASATGIDVARARTPVEQTIGINVAGRQRSYLLVTPAGPTTGLPMLVFLHGIQTTPKGELQRDGFLPLAAEGKAVLVYPGGYRQSWNTDDKCCQAAYAQRINDVAFVHAVTADAIARTHTKTSRTYLAGYSNGGKLAMTIACLAPQGFAAFAEYGGNPDSCPKRIAAPFFLGAGGVDPTEPISGKATDASGPHPALRNGLDAILARNGCRGGGQVRSASTATITSWTGCSKAPATYVLWRTDDHSWPAPPIVASTADAASLMWQFLSAQHK